MSRARRLPRHRRIPIVTKATVPVAVGGAVAAVAMTASPLADALHRGGSSSRAGDGTPDVVMVAPASASPDRSTERASRGHYRPQPGAAASAAPHIRVGGSGGAGSNETGPSTAAAADQGSPTGTATSSDEPTADPTSTDDPPNGNGSPPTAPPGQDPTHKINVPLPTLSTTSLPTLLPTLTPPPLP